MIQSNSNDSKNANPILVQVPNRPNTFYNVAPFLGSTQILGFDENHFEFLTKIMKQCQRVVACANEADLPMEKEDIKLLLFDLFNLETVFEKCTVLKS